MTTSVMERAVRRAGSPEEFLYQLSGKERALLPYLWPVWARPSQLPPEGDWTTWLFLGGRGSGKTRAASEWIRAQVDAGAGRIGLIGRTPRDARDVMIEGESGLLSVFPPAQRPVYEPSKRKLTFHTGAVGHVYSSETPDELRGPQHHCLWFDELATFQHMETWSNAQLGLRLGAHPRQVVTTTPRPVRILREIMDSRTTVQTHSTSYENRAHLPPAFFDAIVSMYEGTRLGRQEINAEMLEDVPGALWTHEIIKYADAPESLDRVAVAVDPSVSDGSGPSQCGIVVCGSYNDRDKDGKPEQRFQVLADRTMRGSPEQWVDAIADAYQEFSADVVVPEKNNGGDMIRALIHTADRGMRVRAVVAARGKAIRAEPVALLYEQDRVRHSARFPQLEDELCTWVHGDRDSPDRMDALVHGLTFLKKPERVMVMVG